MIHRLKTTSSSIILEKKRESSNVASERLKIYMSNRYWWSDYREFSPGEGILPHMGEVIAYYRQRRGFKTQADFAIAANTTTRSVTD